MSFCENVVVVKTSPQNVGDLVFVESLKGLAIIIQNNCVKFIARKWHEKAKTLRMVPTNTEVFLRGL